ncbi:MAG: hexokinase, partial [Candidatus Omnitrophica bacterium]|nr:hexokinase [Candidatus Omnitrophota bacterium]
AVSLRAARTSAACMAAIITKIDAKLSGEHVIAIDGSVYEKHPTFAKNVRIALTEIFGRRASRVKISLVKDGSGIGAAVMAAVASAQ